MFPILNPPPSSLPIPSLWVVPVHQQPASSIVHRTWTGSSFHTWYFTCFNAILPNLSTLSLSHRWCFNRWYKYPGGTFQSISFHQLSSLPIDSPYRDWLNWWLSMWVPPQLLPSFCYFFKSFDARYIYLVNKTWVLFTGQEKREVHVCKENWFF